MGKEEAMTQPLSDEEIAAGIVTPFQPPDMGASDQEDGLHHAYSSAFARNGLPSIQLGTAATFFGPSLGAFQVGGQSDWQAFRSVTLPGVAGMNYRSGCGRYGARDTTIFCRLYAGYDQTVGHNRVVKVRRTV